MKIFVLFCTKKIRGNSTDFSKIIVITTKTDDVRLSVPYIHFTVVSPFQPLIHTNHAKH